jgi:uncharacterized protein (TIGR03086 family)
LFGNAGRCTGRGAPELEDLVTDQIQNCQRALDGALKMIESSSPADLTKQTPCKEWTVQGLIDHMIGVVKNFESGFTGGPPLTNAAGKSLPGESGNNPAAAYQQAADALLQAIRKPGALDQTIKLPFGEMPGGQAINIVIGDQSIHTWDLAKAIGKPYTMDDDLAHGILDMMHKLLQPGFRGEGKGFGEEVPCSPDAPIQDRLIAFAGRQP